MEDKHFIEVDNRVRFKMQDHDMLMVSMDEGEVPFPHYCNKDEAILLMKRFYDEGIIEITHPHKRSIEVLMPKSIIRYSYNSSTRVSRELEIRGGIIDEAKTI